MLFFVYIYGPLYACKKIIAFSTDMSANEGGGGGSVVNILSAMKCILSVKFKQARNPGTVEKRIANSDWRTDKLMNWHDGLTGVQYLSEYILRSKKGTLKNPGETFFKNLLNHFWRKNPVAQWKWVGLNLLYHFWNRGENSE